MGDVGWQMARQMDDRRWMDDEPSIHHHPPTIIHPSIHQSINPSTTGHPICHLTSNI
jgi:hypothetical protein